MPKTSFQELLDAGVHFGHLKRKWNPAMAPYIFMERNGIHIIDLHKTAVKIEEAANAIKQISKSGRKILFVATKKQAKDIIAEKVSSINMPYVVERWPGGMLTNFPTIRKAVKKMSSIDQLMGETSWNNLSKREKLQITRQRAKLEKTLGSIADLNRLPAAMFVVDVMKENIAVREANRLNIPVFGIVDTNSDPTNIDFVIPANDDAAQSIDLIIGIMIDAIKEGMSERKVDKDVEPAPQQDGERANFKMKKGEIRARFRARKAESAAQEKIATENIEIQKVEKNIVRDSVEEKTVVKKTIAEEVITKNPIIEEEVMSETIEPEVNTETVEQEVMSETIEPEVNTETIEPEVNTETVEQEVIIETVEQEVITETVEPEEIKAEISEPEVITEKKEDSISEKTKSAKPAKPKAKKIVEKETTTKAKKEKE